MAERILVAGISGYIAKHVAREFLEAGYSVRGTVRSKTQSQQVRETLRAFGADRLELVEADVLSDKGWAEAVSSCDGVAHLASPFPAAPPKNENDLIGPAVEGTLRVVRASAKAGVPHFVQTSSVAAALAGHDPSKTRFNEDDWSVSDSPTINAHSKSKTLAGRAAREFVANAGGPCISPRSIRDWSSVPDAIPASAPRSTSTGRCWRASTRRFPSFTFASWMSAMWRRRTGWRAR